jgi:hypothetical protein
VRRMAFELSYAGISFCLDTPEIRIWIEQNIGAEVVEAVGRVGAFAALVRKQSGTRWRDWREKAMTGASTELIRLAGRTRGCAATSRATTWPSAAPTLPPRQVAGLSAGPDRNPPRGGDALRA